VATPPYRIETEQTVVRCWEPADAPLLKDAIDTSLDHLVPWMPWAIDEPQSLDAKVALLRTFRSRFDADEDFVYGIFSPDEQRALGGTGLHTRAGDDALEIGYWIRGDSIGRGLATEISAALTRAAFTIAGADRVDIRVDPANERSLRVPRKLGFVEEARLRRRLPARPPGTSARDVLVFTMLAEEFPGSPAEERSAAFAAYDAAGHGLDGS
jgi:RimJ/RimL family protein N-acetyltransferase